MVVDASAVTVHRLKPGLAVSIRSQAEKLGSPPILPYPFAQLIDPTFLLCYLKVRLRGFPSPHNAQDRRLLHLLDARCLDHFDACPILDRLSVLTVRFWSLVHRIFESRNFSNGANLPSSSWCRAPLDHEGAGIW